MRVRALVLASSFATLVALPALAEEAPTDGGAPPRSAVEVAREEPKSIPIELTPIGYVEAYYAYNFNRPSNAITNYRGFDNRHATFSLSNAALGAQAGTGPVTTRLIFQVGSTPETYYGSEPGLAGAGGANATSAELWKYLQEANVAWKAPVGRGLELQMGLVASPIGYEVFAVKDNWNWSRSNLFFGLPFYHTGLRARYAWTDALSTSFGVFNGWNSVVDANEEKSVQTNVAYREDGLFLQVLYWGGVERPTGSPEGPYWRHHFDVVAEWEARRWLTFAAQADHGWEPNRFGTARWSAGALYARVQPARWLYVAARGDRFHEHLATEGAPGGRASAPIFWGGSEWVSSYTTTIDVRPHDNLSVRLEYRHDESEAPIYFRRGVLTGPGGAFLPNATSQDTILLGATAWL